MKLAYEINGWSQPASQITEEITAPLDCSSFLVLPSHTQAVLVITTSLTILPFVAKLSVQGTHKVQYHF